VGPRLDADPAASGEPGKGGNLSVVPDAVSGGPSGASLADTPGAPGGVG
jgi:hypothetical protein